jgi:hypothetical protein
VQYAVVAGAHRVRAARAIQTRYRIACRRPFRVVHNAGWTRGANHGLRGRLRA